MQKSKKPKNWRVVFIDAKSSDRMRTEDMQDSGSETDIRDYKAGKIKEKDREWFLMKTAFNIVEDVLQAALATVGGSKYYTRKVWVITHGEFTVERGRRYIQKLISTCKHRVAWAFYTEFMWKEDVIHSFYYVYRVSWGVPSAPFPMAIVFTFAYFTLKINKNKPPEAPVELSFIFEEQKFIQRKELICYQDGILSNTIEIKYILINQGKAVLGLNYDVYDIEAWCAQERMKNATSDHMLIE